MVTGHEEKPCLAVFLSCMPIPSDAKLPNRSRWGLANEFPDDLICVRVFVPNSQYYLDSLYGRLRTLAQQIYYDRDENKTAKRIAELWKKANNETLSGNVFVSCSGTDIPINPDTDGDMLGTNESLDKFLDLLVELDMKFTLDGKLYEAAIPLIECGCGDGGSGDNRTIPGSTPGNVGYGELTTICDFNTTVIPYIQTSVDDMLDRIQNGFIPVIIGQILPTDFVDTALELVQESLDAIQGEIFDTTYKAELDQASMKYFPDPIETFTRSNLLGWVYQTPQFSDFAPMQSALIIWALSANIENLNNAVKNAANTSQPGACDSLYQQFNRPPYNPDLYQGEGGGILPDIMVSGYRLKKLFTEENFISAQQFNRSFPDNPEPFVGIFVRWQLTPPFPVAIGVAVRIRSFETNVVLGESTSFARQVEAGSGAYFSDFFSISNATAIRGELEADASFPVQLKPDPTYGKSVNINFYNGTAFLTQPIDNSPFYLEIDSTIGGTVEAWVVTIPE